MIPDTLKLRASRRYGALSPLRYPGGKASLAGLFSDVLAATGMHDATYVEPYAGGAGAGVALLREGLISHLVINDFDPAVYSFWRAITDYTREFISLIVATPLTVDEWKRQREIYRRADTDQVLELGFAFFYLNRTNRSGVLTGGVIGGLEQRGNYKIDARYNRSTLIDRIEAIGSLANRITVTSRDGRSVIRDYGQRDDVLLYIDPPYVVKGSRLYLNAFNERDHAALADVVNAVRKAHWLMTYDVHPLIEELYSSHYQTRFELYYSARNYVVADELMIASPAMAEALQIATRQMAESA